MARAVSVIGPRDMGIKAQVHVSLLIGAPHERALSGYLQAKLQHIADLFAPMGRATALSASIGHTYLHVSHMREGHFARGATRRRWRVLLVYHPGASVLLAKPVLKPSPTVRKW